MKFVELFRGQIAPGLTVLKGQNSTAFLQMNEWLETTPKRTEPVRRLENSRHGLLAEPDRISPRLLPLQPCPGYQEHGLAR